MIAKRLPDVRFIRECVDYDTATGVFTWRRRPMRHFPTLNAHNRWNTQFAGKLAGSCSADRNNYWKLCFSGKVYKAHRIAWLLVYGRPVPTQLDHINGNPLDNRIANLRRSTISENGRNRRIQRTPTVTGVKGVYYRERGNSRRFTAHIGINGKRVWLGNFATIEEAISARREAADRLHLGFANHG